MDSKEIPTKLLIDLGNSDAIWLFAEKIRILKSHRRILRDYLGRGSVVMFFRQLGTR
jgi:hypothetical protein